MADSKQKQTQPHKDDATHALDAPTSHSHSHSHSPSSPHHDSHPSSSHPQPTSKTPAPSSSSPDPNLEPSLSELLERKVKIDDGTSNAHLITLFTQLGARQKAATKTKTKTVEGHELSKEEDDVKKIDALMVTLMKEMEGRGLTPGKGHAVM